MRYLRAHRQPIGALMIALMTFWQIGQPLQAATFYWDTDSSTTGNNTDGTGLGGTGNWNTSTSNWWDSTNLVVWPNTNADIALFSGLFSILPTLNTVTLSSGITANQLSFQRSGHTLTGGDLTLAGTTPTLHANLGATATIDSLIQGAEGLTKTGGGAIRLGNAANSYTGVTTINNGILVIGNAGALGSDTSAIVVNGSVTRGFGGGALLLQGGYASGVDLTRTLSLQGQGPIVLGAALLSVGTNSVASLSNGPGTINTIVNSANGRLTVGDLALAGTPATTFMTFGVTNSVGVGSYAITGAITGTGSINKTGAGTLILSPSSTAGFAGTIRVTAGSVRISSAADLGNNMGTVTGSLIDLAGDTAVLEVRADSHNFGKNVYNRAAGSPTIFLDHAIGSSAVNGTAGFGILSYDVNETLTFSSRNGFGASFTSAPVDTGDGATTITNNMGGDLTIAGNLWNNANNTANRILTISGTGRTVVGGDLMASSAAFNHSLSKTGTGLLTILGTVSNLDGTVSVQGSLAITDFRSINNNSQSITLGSATTTSGNLIIGTSAAAMADGLITNKAIIFNNTSTTATSAIYANQTGASPVVLNGTITKPNATSYIIILGGTNTADNVINSAIPLAGTGGLRKDGSGTWVLAGENLYSGATTIGNGTLKLKANAATSTILSSANDITFNQFNQFSGGTLEFVGQNAVNNVQILDLLTVTTGGNTIKLSPGTAGTASLVFTSAITVADGASVNFVGADATNTVTFSAAGTGLLSSRAYFNGSDFAYADAGVLRAPVYGTDANFVTSATALTATDTNEITGSFATNSITIDSLKINGAHTLTLNAAQTLTIRTGAANTDGTILATNGSSVITGGTGISVGGSGSLSIRVDGATDTLTLNSLLTSGTTGGVTKDGAGVLILAGVNAQTGTFTINEGTVRLSGSGRLAANNVSVTMRQGATIDLNGVTPSGSTNSWNNNGVLTNSSATAVTFNVGGSNGTGTSFGTFTQTHGVINILKSGSGAQSWLGLSNYTGSTTIGSTGLVTVDVLANIGEDSGIGRGDAGNNAASLVFSGTTGGLVYAGNVRNGNLVLGSVSASTDRLFTMAGTGATLSSTATNGNSIVWSNTSAIGHTGAAARTLTLTGTSTGDNRLNPLITDSGTGANITGITKTGAGVWVLGNAANTYTGATTVSNGTLALGSAGSLPDASNLVLDGGVLQTSGTWDRLLGTGADQFQFMPSGANAAKFSGGFSGGDAKLVLDWSAGGVPIWGGTTHFLGTRNGLILSSTVALSEVEIASDFSLGTASGAAKTPTVTTTNSSPTIAFTAGDTSGLQIGQFISGTSIPVGAYIVSIDSATSITISANVGSSSGTTGVAATIGGSNMRPIRVDDNTVTGTDFATITGDISGDAGTGIRKLGTGVLQLFGENTYSGETNVAQGTLVVTSLGLSTEAATGTSVGTNIGANTVAQALTLGNGVTGAGILQYVGTGEISDRMIRLNTTTGSTQIHADGSGALILTNVLNDMAAGNKTLVLRGANAMGNMITSVLTDNGGTLGITADMGGTWILTGDNTYTGTTSITAGALGAGHNNAFGTSGILLRNGSLFAYGGDRTITNAITVNSTTTAGTSTFIGDHSLSLTGNWTLANTTAGHVITNTLVSGKTLTIGGNLGFGALSGDATLTVNGTGETIINGNIVNSTGSNLALTYSGTGTLTLGGTNNHKGTTSVSGGGTLRLSGSGTLGTGALTVSNGTLEITGSVDPTVTTLTVGGGTGVSGTVDIGTGRVLTASAVTYSGTGSLTGVIGGLGTLNLGASGITVTVADNVANMVDMSWEMGALTGSDVFTKAGAGTLDIRGITTNSFSGSYQLNAGAILGLGGSTGKNLILNGGVYEGSGTFTRALGTGDDQVQWAAGGGGGFSAQGGALTVTLSGAPSPLVWDSTPFFVTGAGALLFGSTSADNVVTFTHDINLNGAVRTISVVDNTTLTTDRADLSGVLSNGGISKTGNGVLRLDGLNTFTGGITVSAGTLQFSTVSNNGGAASNLGLGTDGITLSGGTLAFVGSSDQSTNRAIALPSSSTLDASGTGGASITYNGLITGGSAHLTLTGTGMGVLNAAVTQTGTSADLNKNGTGTWRLDVAQPGLIDDVIINEGTLILNAADAHDGDDLHIRAGTLRLNVNGALTNTMDDLNVSAETAGGGVLDVNGTTGSAPTDIILGTETLSGSIIDSVGTGSIGATGTLVFRNGVVSAHLTGAAALTKNGFTAVTLSGNNAGFTGSTTMVNGLLTLDYTTNNGEKLSDTAALISSGGGNITLNGNASSATTEVLGSLTLNAGALHINVNHGAGQTATLNLGAITRAAGGTVEFNLSSGSSIVQTSSVNGAGGLLGGYATVNGSQFATVSGGVIQGLSSTVSNNLAAWQTGGDLTDSTGYTGTVSDIMINSLRFNAADVTSTVTVASGSLLTIRSGGILVTSEVGSGPASITGGALAGGGNDLTVHQNNVTSAFTIGSSITGSNTLTKSGLGTLLLNGTNTYTGQTTINEGTLLLSGGNAIGDGSFVTIKNDANAVLDLNNSAETIAGLASFGGLSTTGFTSGMVAIGSGTLTLSLTGARSYQGGISGDGTLVKTGASDQNFFGANAGFTGTVIINQGLVNLSESATVLSGATAFILNGSGELLGDQDVADIDHIGNTATITLNNTGANRGLWIRNLDLASAEAETVGAIILGAGHNVIQADQAGASGSSGRVITLTSASLTRNNHATLLVRGQSLGQSSTDRGRIIFTASPVGAVGGGGGAATTTMSILPYIIGESTISTDATLADNFGNSFVFNTGTTSGLRPLDLTTEYILDEAGYNALTGAALDNVRFAANPAAALTGSATQINSLVLDSSSAALTVNGPASALNIKSGAILATTTTAANGISLGGFSSLTTDAGNDFIIYVTNAANTFTLNSALTSATPLVKSGAGTLALTNTGNAFTDVYLNQGFVQVDNMDKLGAGELKFMGGGIKLAPGFTGDLFAKTWDISTGGGSLDVGLFSGGFTLTDGIVDSTASSSDVFSFFTRATGSTGDDGLLILQGASAFTGTTVFNHTGLNSGVINSVVLNGTTNQTILGNVIIGNTGTIANNNFDVTVALGADEQIIDTASITFNSTSGEEAYFKLLGFTETVAGISAASRGVIENHESAVDAVAGEGKLIVNSSEDFSYTGFIRDAASAPGGALAFEKQGTGTQMLIGASITHTGTTTISGGTLHLQGVTLWNSNIVNNSLLILDETTARTHARDITGTGSLIKQGTAALTFAGGLNLTYQGSTTVKNGTLTIGSSINGTTSLNVLNGGSTLALTGGITDASSITNVVVEHGGTLSLLDGVGNKLTDLTTLQLGSSGGTMTTLNLNVGDFGAAGDNLNTDLLSLLTGGTLSLFAGNQITLNLTDAGLNPLQTYNLISTDDSDLLSVLGSGDWLLGSTPGGFTSITLNKTNNLISITTGTLITGASYWTGLTDNTWNVGANNWSTDKAGTTPASSIPGQGTDVVFVANSHAGGALVTTLEQNFKVNSLTFEASTSTPSSVTINPGAITTSRLEVAPQVATDGIRITAGGPAAVTIATALRLGASQTWNVADAASILTVSGSLLGEADVVKTGAGKVTLSAIADPTFNTGLTTDVTINAGILEITNAGALGTLASSNPANVTINGGAFYYNNAVAGTVVNALTLSGGTLSAGGATQTYSGTVDVSGNSFINMRDNNSAVTSTAARSITLTGVLSGSGSLTVDSVDTLTAGNAETGTVTINGLANTWTGELAFQRGTVVFTSNPITDVNAGHTGALTFNQFGRVIYRNLNGETLNRTGALTFAAGSIGELSVDNISAVLGADYVINQNGLVTLGSGGTGATARFNLADAASQLNLTGGVVLGGNSSISVEGGDADSIVTVSSVISDGGSGYSLAVNDDAGAWAATNTIIRLTGLNTFTGNISLTEGTLQFNTVTNISSGASALGNGTAISMAGGTLSFIGTTAQSTDRPITTTASATLSANGDEAADTITYNGAITQAANNSLVLSGTAEREGIITGGITQSGTTADLTVNGGTWTLSGTSSTIADDVVVTGTTTVLNLNTAGVIAFGASTGNLLQILNGAVLNLGATDTMTGFADTGLYIAQSSGGAEAILNMNGFDQTFLRLILGERLADRSGLINGSGTLTISGTTGFELYKGTINANLASTAATPFNKYGPGTVTLRGDNSGIATTTAAIINEGTLVLDYTASNTTKLRAASALDMRGGNLELLGNASAATVQDVGSFTTGTGGNSIVTLTPGAGQDIVLNLNAFTRGLNAQDGTVRFNLPTGAQSATNGITTDSLNTIGTGANAILGGWATVNDGTGVFFAQNVTNAANGNLGIANTTLQDAVASWVSGENISDSTGFTGALGQEFILNTLRFNAASGSDLDLGTAGLLRVTSGGILVTGNVVGTPSITGGTLHASAFALPVATGELIITHDSASTFEIGSNLHRNLSLTKSGTGTLLLTGTNAHTGYTEIQNGTLVLSGGNAIGDTSLVTLASGRDSTLELLTDETIGRLAGGRRNDNSDYGTVAIGAHTLTLNHSGGNTIYAGFLTGSGSLVMSTGSTSQLNITGISTGFTGSVVVSGGLLHLSGTGGRIGASSFTINKGGNLLLDNNTNQSSTRILDTTPVTLNSADGTWAGQTIVRGLAIRINENVTTNETIGVLAFNSGASYLSGEASGTTGVATIIASNFVRANNATLSARGRARARARPDDRGPQPVPHWRRHQSDELHRYPRRRRWRGGCPEHQHRALGHR